MLEGDAKICTALERGRFWEPDVAALIDKYANPDWTFVDLGAHVGSFTLLAASRFKNVIAVEANPAAAEILKKNVEWNELANVEVYECGVWDEDGEIAFMPQVANSGSSWVASRKKKPDAVTVQAKTLPQILGERRPEMWKIDIEGAEYRALYNCLEVLDGAQVILTEYCVSQLERTSGATGRDYYDLLVDAGFEWYRMDGQPIPFEEMLTGGYDNYMVRR